MAYVPVTAVWEITMGCNMRCGHCGSSCAEPLPDELTTEEALRVIEDMAALGMRYITLSGGEPLLRRDWPVLAGHLTRHGIAPNIITNGWLVDEQMVRTADANGVQTISISLDGTRETHDAIRRNGAFDRALRAFDVLDAARHVSGANTTVTKLNIGELEAIREILIAHGVDLWQIQIGLPMGTLAQHREQVLEPEAVEYLLEFSHQTTLAGRIKVFPADCLGYFTAKESQTRSLSLGSFEPVVWQGCNAGKRSFGLLHNGDVVGCTSIRQPEFIEGNIRERSLRQIWEDPGAFAWSRGMKKTDLSGDCRECCYGDVCLGGCPNTRLTIHGTIHAGTEYCAFHLAMDETRRALARYDDPEVLLQTARTYQSQDKGQLAYLTLQRAAALDPAHADVQALLGFAAFSIGNFEACLTANQAVLDRDPGNAYALKGMGLALHRLSRSEEGLQHLHRATERAGPAEQDSFYDLAVVYRELGRPMDARAALERGAQRFPGFMQRAGGLYAQVLQEAAIQRP
ncbi:MAG: radical SAM protein [Pseudomonadota bacterium]